jgi:hypothetical protein
LVPILAAGHRSLQFALIGFWRSVYSGSAHEAGI